MSIDFINTFVHDCSSGSIYVAILNVRSVDAKLVTVEKVWPMFIKCKQWKSSDNERSAECGSNTTQKGSNSTYV